MSPAAGERHDAEEQPELKAVDYPHRRRCARMQVARDRRQRRVGDRLIDRGEERRNDRCGQRPGALRRGDDARRFIRVGGSSRRRLRGPLQAKQAR